MKYNKIVKENEYNKNSFLITCVCSILLLLTLCYFGVNSEVKGTYSAAADCKAGTYYSGSEIMGCVSCPSGYTSPAGSDNKNDCYLIGSTSCSAGTYRNDSGTCSTCPAGTTSNAGADSVEDCYSTSSSTCPSGEYYSDAAGDCTTCPVNHYCPAGDNALHACPSNTTSLGGSDSESDCMKTCAAGKYYNGNGSCSTCDAGYYCPSSVTASVTSTTVRGRTACPSGQWSQAGATSCSSVSSTACYTSQPSGYDCEWNESALCYWNCKTSGSTTEKACYYCSDTSSYVWTSSPGALCSPKSTYSDEDSCKNANSTVEYTVSYIANGGSVSPTSQKVVAGTFITLPTPTKSGSDVFAGWYTAASGGSFVAKGGTSYKVTKTLTLYAQWVSPDDKKCYQCSVDKSYVWSATIPNSSCVEVNKTAAECEDAAQSSGTTSACYYCSDDKSYVWSATVPGSSCSKASYYTKSACESAGDSNGDNDNDTGDSGNGGTATPTSKTYTAKFDANGGTLKGSSSKSCSTTGSSCTVSGLPTATRSGYTFGGWGTSKSCNSGYTNSVKITKDTTYYACWSKVQQNNNNNSGVDNEGNVTENQPTGEITTIAIIWFVGLLAIGYAFYYFKSVKEN